MQTFLYLRAAGQISDKGIVKNKAVLALNSDVEKTTLGLWIEQN
jgi:hypothetical protein